MGASAVWCRFLGWSRARVRPAGGTRARRCPEEKRRAGRLHDGADRDLRPSEHQSCDAQLRCPRERAARPGTWLPGHGPPRCVPRTTPMERAPVRSQPRWWRHSNEAAAETARAPAGPGHGSSLCLLVSEIRTPSEMTTIPSTYGTPTFTSSPSPIAAFLNRCLAPPLSLGTALRARYFGNSQDQWISFIPKHCSYAGCFSVSWPWKIPAT